jgi:hypothetical protein
MNMSNTSQEEGRPSDAANPEYYTNHSINFGANVKECVIHGHRGVLIPVCGMIPSSDRFEPLSENVEIDGVMRKVYLSLAPQEQIWIALTQHVISNQQVAVPVIDGEVLLGYALYNTQICMERIYYQHLYNSDDSAAQIVLAGDHCELVPLICVDVSGS